MLRAIFKIFFLLSLALLLPRFLLLYAPQQHMFFGVLNQKNPVELGFVSFLEFLRQTKLDLDKKRVLLVSNQLPEKNHGSYLSFLNQYGVVPSAVCRVQYSNVFTKNNLSLEKQHKPGLVVNGFVSKEFKKSDLILLDFQNSGFAQDDALKNLIEVLRLSHRYKKKLIIFDRPNPLGGLVEGPLVKIVSSKLQFSLPLRYGLTIGEVVNYLNDQLFNNQISIVILPLKYYLRNNFNDFEQLQKVYTDFLFESLRGTCPFEIKTDCRHDFQCLALPEYLNFSIDKWYELRALLWHQHIDVSMCRYFERKTDQYFMGVRLIIDDINRVSYIKIWQIFFKFMNQANINLHSTLFLRQIFGEQFSRELLQGNLKKETLDLWSQELAVFYKKIKKYLIYRPYPIKILL